MVQQRAMEQVIERPLPKPVLLFLVFVTNFSPSSLRRAVRTAPSLKSLTHGVTR